MLSKTNPIKPNQTQSRHNTQYEIRDTKSTRTAAEGLAAISLCLVPPRQKPSGQKKLCLFIKTSPLIAQDARAAAGHHCPAASTRQLFPAAACHPCLRRLCGNWDFASFAPDLEQKTKVIMPILVYFCHYDTAWERRGAFECHRATQSQFVADQNVKGSGFPPARE